MLYVGIILWITCSFISYGMTVGYFQKTYPRLAAQDAISDRVKAGIMAVAGPIDLVVILSLLRPYRWKL